MLSTSRVVEMNTQISLLQQDVIKLEKSVSYLERIASRALQEHKEFDIHKADDILQFLSSLAGQVAVLQSKLTNLHDQEIMDKIHKSMKSVMQNDRDIENSFYNISDTITSLHNSIRNDISLWHIYCINAIVSDS
jgi:hypothetical protein